MKIKLFNLGRLKLEKKLFNNKIIILIDVLEKKQNDEIKFVCVFLLLRF